MGRLIARCWAEFWVPAQLTDSELARLCGLQPHHLISLAERAPEAVIDNNSCRCWRLRRCMPHIRGLK